MDETPLVRKFQDTDFNNYNLTNRNSVTLTTQAVIDNQFNTNSYIDQFHQANDRFGRGLVIDFYNKSSDLVKGRQDKNFHVKILPNLENIRINRTTKSDND